MRKAISLESDERIKEGIGEGSEYLEIITPPAEELLMYRGVKKELWYKLKNISDYKLDNVDLIVKTERPTDETRTEWMRTLQNYAQVKKIGTQTLLPGWDTDVIVEVVIPLEYREFIEKSDGKKVLVPFRLSAEATALSVIE